MRKLQNFIDGKWTDSASGRRVQDLNPADTAEVVADAPNSTAAEAAAACEAAARAFEGLPAEPEAELEPAPDPGGGLQPTSS